MNEQCIVVGNDILLPKYIAEDDIPRDGGRWPEYARTMQLCVDSFEHGLAKGRLYNFYFEEQDTFASLDQLLFAMEDVMEKAQMPQSMTELRRAVPVKKKGRRKKNEAPLEDAPYLVTAPYHSLDTLRPHRGKLASFYIRVITRQHSSMQGLLVDASDDERYAFRSELELIRFLRDLLEQKTSIRKEEP